MTREPLTKNSETGPGAPDERKQSLEKMFAKWKRKSPWLNERACLMQSYLDFAYDRAVSDSVRFRALERFADMLDRGTGPEGCAPLPLPDEIGARLEQSVAQAPAALRAILHLAQSREVSDSVRLRALEKILASMDRGDDHGAEQDQPLPEEWERALRRFERDLGLGAERAAAAGDEPRGAAAGRGPDMG